MTQTPREPAAREPDRHQQAKRRTPPDVDKDGDEIPQAGLPTEDVDLDTRPRR
jgi:hypothetical protein